MSFSSKKTFYTRCHNLVLERLHTSCMTSLREDSWKLAPGYCPMCLFPFADFALHHFAVINYNCGYKYTLYSVSPPSKLPNYRWSWEPLTQWISFAYS